MEESQARKEAAARSWKASLWLALARACLAIDWCRGVVPAATGRRVMSESQGLSSKSWS